MAEATISPMMRQFHRIKASYPDAILFFRLGDFYEMFFEDAEIASPILGITLTARNRGSATEPPITPEPHHPPHPKHPNHHQPPNNHPNAPNIAATSA